MTPMRHRSVARLALATSVLVALVAGTLPAQAQDGERKTFKVCQDPNAGRA